MYAVFGTGNDISSSAIPGTEIPAQRTFADEGTQLRGNWQPSIGSDWNFSGIPEETLQGSAYDTIDGGLCWLWDTTWNGFERQ